MQHPASQRRSTALPRLRATLGRTLAGLLALAFLSPTHPARAATNTAAVHLFSTSFQVDPGRANLLGQVYEMTFSSYGNWIRPNGEFYTFFGELRQTNYSALLLWDVNWDMRITQGAIAVIVPHEIDDPVDGVPDFYQVNEAINAVSTGGTFALADPTDPEQLYDSGTVTAHWQRAAGEHRGSCTLTLSGGSLVFMTPTDFVHAFEIREFVGTYDYVPTPDPRVGGHLAVTQIGDDVRRFAGPLTLERTDTTPGVEFLILQSGWTGTASLPVELLGGYLWDHDLRYALEYYGPLSLQDGDPTTPDENDYYDFFLAIDDPNDADGDGLPDLSDPVRAQPPELRLLWPAAAAPVLRILGRSGDRIEIQATADLLSGPWSSPLPAVVTLTNAQQEIVLPTPLGEVTFYRALLLNP